MRRTLGFCKVEEEVKGLPASPEHPLRQGYTRLESGDLRGAQEAFNLHLLQKRGSAAEDSLAYLGLGRSYRREEKPAHAVVALGRSLQLREDPRVRIEYAQALFEIGLFERSLAAWKRLRRSKEVAPARWQFEVARCLDHLGRKDKAMEAYEEAISLDPDSLFASTAQSRVTELVPAILDPISQADQEVVAAERAKGLSLLARATLDLGDQKEAERLFKEVFESGSGSADALVAFGRFRAEAGDGAGAEAAYRKALEADPQYGAANLELARMVLSAPEGLQEGFRLLMKARDAGGEEGYRAAARMVRLYREVGQAEDARFLLEELEAAEEAPPDLRDWAREELGRGQGASLVPGHLAESTVGGG
jgi:tetratricopeptide (TPR) repeat protein